MTPTQRSRAAPYHQRLERLRETAGQPGGDSLYKIIKDFEKNEVHERHYTVTIEGVTYPVLLKNVSGKIASSIRVKSTEDAIQAGKLLILCLSKIDDVLRNGKKSFLPWIGESPKKHAPEGRPGNNKKSNKHEYSSWLYINDYSVEPGLSGEVMVEIEFPGKEKSQKNNIYHIATNRSVGYTRMKEGRFAPNIVLEGVVTIRRV